MVKIVVDAVRNANPVVIYAVAFFATLVVGGLVVLALPIVWTFIDHMILVPIGNIISGLV